MVHIFECFVKEVKDLMSDQIQKKHKSDTYGEWKEIIEWAVEYVWIATYNIENIKNEIKTQQNRKDSFCCIRNQEFFDDPGVKKVVYREEK